MTTRPPLTSWTCDVCHKLIEKPEDGYVVWTDDQLGARDFTVIHQNVCDDHSKHLSQALGDFLGVDGLAKLTGMMTYGPFKNNESAKIYSLSEFTDFMRRMQLPHYEEARRNFHLREAKDDYSDANEYLPYLQSQLQKIANYKPD